MMVGTTLFHEMGHALGLFHTFTGSEVGCDNKCHEFQSSAAVGDLVADTPPDFRNGCVVPKAAICGKSSWLPAPLYDNMMAYHPCKPAAEVRFTSGQLGRMHCYLDLLLQTWTRQEAPSFIPTAPQLLSGAAGAVSITWLKPMKFTAGRGATGGDCRYCSTSGVILQYALTAVPSGNVPKGASASSVLGAPNQKEQCKSGYTSFSGRHNPSHNPSRSPNPDSLMHVARLVLLQGEAVQEATLIST